MHTVIDVDRCRRVVVCVETLSLPLLVVRPSQSSASSRRVCRCHPPCPVLIVAVVAFVVVAASTQSGDGVDKVWRRV